MGPILLMTNRLTALGNPMTLASTRGIVTPLPVQKVVQEALRQQGDTGYPQAIILSGVSGSGKTYSSMLILRELFETAGGGVETDAYKHLAASITVLRSLGTARTTLNRDSSRVVSLLGNFGLFISCSFYTDFPRSLFVFFITGNPIRELNYIIYCSFYIRLKVKVTCKS